MKQITEQELFDFYCDTLDRCGVFVLNEDNDTIKYTIYEDFNIGIHSFFHINSLQRLCDNGLISLNKLNESVLLRNNVIDLQATNEWRFEHFKTSEKWRQIMVLCDKIRAIE